MIERLANVIVCQMEEENCCNQYEKEYYEYALIIMIERWITVLTVIRQIK